MASVCEFSGTRPLTGHKISNSNRKTKRRQMPNLQKRRFFIPELKKSITLTLTARALRSIEKNGGISQAILRAKPENLSPRLQIVRTRLQSK